MQGTLVGSYLIEEKIGEGGMGVVYTAKHTRMTGRAVVKVLHPHFAHNQTIAKRFENEANAAASIGHPGIVQIFDVGRSQDGCLYIIMELLEGESLQQRLNRVGYLPVDQAVSIIRQVAGALGAAHKAGIVHRDLKPDNLFLVADPEVPGGERVKILDFGIAKLADDDANGMNTGTGTMMGTPHFMSPEQCRGAGDVDYRTDLYALGCILFLLLTGRTPFVGEGAGEFIAQHLTQPPPTLRTLVPEAPDYLEDLISVLLAKNPAERFQSTEALVAALDGFRGGASHSGASHSGASHSGASHSGATASQLGLANTGLAPHTQPAPSPTTLGASIGHGVPIEDQNTSYKGRRSPLVIVAPLLLAGAAAAFFAVRKGDEPPTPPAPTPAQQPAPLKPPALALKAMEDYRNPQGSAITQFNSSAWWQAVATDFEEAASQKGAPPEWQAGRSVALGFITMLDSDFAGAASLFREATTLAPDWPIGHAVLSIGLARLGEYDAALAAARDAQRVDPQWPGAIAASARVLVSANRLDDAIQEYRRALGMDKENPNLLSELSLVYHATHVDAEATRYATKALSLDPDLVAPRIMLAERALEDKDGETALQEASRAVATAPRSLSAHLAYADALALLKKKSDAMSAYEKVLEIYDAKGDTVSEHDARIALVRAALAKGRLPARRGAGHHSRAKDSKDDDRSQEENDPVETDRSRSNNRTIRRSSDTARPPTPVRSSNRNDPFSGIDL